MAAIGALRAQRFLQAKTMEKEKVCRPAKLRGTIKGLNIVT